MPAGPIRAGRIFAQDTPARIAVIGAGPIGLEAALYARYLGYEVDVFEAAAVGHHVRSWGFLTMLTSFGENSTTLGRAAVKAQDPGALLPAADATILGREYVAAYLEPLAQTDLLHECVRTHCRVLAIERRFDVPDEEPPTDEWEIENESAEESRPIQETAEPEEAPGATVVGDAHVHDVSRPSRFTVHVTSAEGPSRTAAEIVIDVRGTYGTPRSLPFLEGAMPCEPDRDPTFLRHLPDVTGADRSLFAQRVTLLIGSGCAAAATLLALARLAKEAPQSRVIWLTRSTERHPFTIEPEADRRTLAGHLHAASELAEHLPSSIVHHAGYELASIERTGRNWKVEASRNGNSLWFSVDTIVGLIGYRPGDDVKWIVHGGASGVPAAESSPLTVPPHVDVASSSNPCLTGVPHLYRIGSQSWGENGRFRFTDGHRQIRELFAGIAGRANLDLYGTLDS